MWGVHATSRRRPCAPDPRVRVWLYSQLIVFDLSPNGSGTEPSTLLVRGAKPVRRISPQIPTMAARMTGCSSASKFSPRRNSFASDVAVIVGSSAKRSNASRMACVKFGLAFSHGVALGLLNCPTDGTRRGLAHPKLDWRGRVFSLRQYWRFDRGPPLVECTLNFCGAGSTWGLPALWRPLRAQFRPAIKHGCIERVVDRHLDGAPVVALVRPQISRQSANSPSLRRHAPIRVSGET